MVTKDTGAGIKPGELDGVIHERVRLSIASVLAARRKVDYLELRSLLGLTDGNLAGHIRVLEYAKYINVKKKIVGKKMRTTYHLTPAGRKAFQRHVEQLARLLPLEERR